MPNDQVYAGHIQENFINIIPNTLVDDFFIFGFFAGLIGYAYYLYINRDDPKNHISKIAGFYGTFLSGCVGGMLAIVFDQSIEISIIVGLFNQLIYMAIIKSVRSGKFMTAIKDILIKYLTAGKV